MIFKGVVFMNERSLEIYLQTCQQIELAAAAIDDKLANVLQLNTNQVFTLEGKMINGVKS